MGSIIKTALGLVLGAVLVGLFRWALAVGWLDTVMDFVFNQKLSAISDVRKTLKSVRQEQFLNEQSDVMDMPPWEHEDEWNKISNKYQSCWFHKRTLKKVCKDK